MQKYSFDERIRQLRAVSGLSYDRLATSTRVDVAYVFGLEKGTAPTRAAIL